MGRIDEYTRRVYAEILFGFIRKIIGGSLRYILRRGMFLLTETLTSLHRRCVQLVNPFLEWTLREYRWVEFSTTCLR
jgi:hypothetical protein